MLNKFINELNEPNFKYSNFYMNLFNILYLVDIFNEQKDIRLYYNGIHIISFDRNGTIDITEVLNDRFVGYEYDIDNDNEDSAESISSGLKFYNEDYKFNPLFSYIDISKETYDRLLRSKILELNHRTNYDIISERINKLTLIAQRNLTRYLKLECSKKYSVYDLFSSMLKVYQSNPFELFYDIEECNSTNYLICNYSKMYKYLYLDSLVLITLYTKYITKFQSEIAKNNKLKKIYLDLGQFSNDFADLIHNSHSDLCIKNGSNVYRLCTEQGLDYKHSITKSLCSFFTNTMYSIPNSIFNLLSYLDEIESNLNSLDNTYINLKLLRPYINDMNKTTSLSPFSIALRNLTILSAEVLESTNRINVLVDENEYKDDCRYSYGDYIKYASLDPAGYIVNPLQSKKLVCGNCNNAMATSFFYGYMQNNKIHPFAGSTSQYLSSVWLRPLLCDELLNSISFNTHLVPCVRLYAYTIRNNIYGLKTYLKCNRRLEEGTLLYMSSSISNLSYGSRKSLYNANVPLVEKKAVMPEYEATFYNTSLGSMFMLRGYIIGIMEMISRNITCKLLLPLSKTESKEFKQWFKNRPCTKNAITKNFRDSSKIKLDDENCITEEQIDCHYASSVCATSFYIYGKEIFSIPMSRDRYESSFYSFFMDAFKISPSVLEEICNIAKEDYLSCPII